MEKSQLVAVLRSFSKKEIRDFRKWLQSPAHNLRDDVLELFEYLVGYEHLDNEKFLEKERVFRKIFPEETYDDAKLRQSMHFLLRAVEDFLVYQETNDNEVHVQMTLARVYRKRSLDKFFQKVVRQIEQCQEKSALRDAQYMLDGYLLEQERYRYLSQQKRTSQLNLQEVTDAIDLFYLSDKLRQSCILLSHQAVYKTGYDMGLLDGVLHYVEENRRFLQVPAIGIYYYIYKATTEKEIPGYFEQLKAYIEQYSHHFSHTDLRDIYLLALNYCIGKMNTGERQYIREAFDIIRQGLEIGVWIEHGILNRYSFRNFVAIGMGLREFAWVERFINDYQHFLDPKHRENFVHFALSSLYYEQGDYEKARQLLIHFEYTDILINLQAKSMLIKMYYREGELEALESLLESLRNYMHRKKVIGYHKNIYNTFIRYIRKLIRLNPYNRSHREKLRREIEESKQLREKKWFLEQLEAM